MNKKWKKILLLWGVLVSVTACGKSGNFDQSMQKTREAIVEKKFEQAEGFVEMALESKPKDEEAKNYQSQLKLYINALDKKEKKEYDEAKASLDAVIKIEHGSDKLVEYAKKEKTEISKMKKEAEKDDSKKEEKTTESSDKKEEASNTVWNDSKRDSLRGFMAQFSNKMGQDYKEYSKTSSVDLYGVNVPGDIFSGEWTMAINNQPVKVEWSETGEGSSAYQLVAVYSDADTQPYLQKHVYFFIIENGQPKVYVTQQNQGNNENYLHFSETQNSDIKAGFSQIVGGEQISNNAEKSFDIASFDDAKKYLLNNRESWSYATQDKNASNIEVISVNENNKEQHKDGNGNYYSVVIQTNDDDGSTTGGGKQFRVYTDGRIYQRVGMHDFSQVYP
ncbi:DUF4767 domain-containing protein [Vagococcus luciliae]|uniref:DUF4767 domain-containing protein n=1 Tax=Vagococcus luciliae TaxID=2920380 RepID=A0ABY5NX52_9ENTE|nr:DUF4767 domain-containing protein [Vagococcus luciliae]UUV98157.1 hypothetical protein G314FT_02480 [Vagococcus luciliae]